MHNLLLGRGSALFACTALVLLASPAEAQQSAAPSQGSANTNAPRTGAPAGDNGQRTIVIIGSRLEDTPEKLDYIQREVDGTLITVTKKTSVAILDRQPTVIDNNQRELFSRLPGLFVSEQSTPTQFNLSYRGMGNPQESEYVLVLQDGIPISTDWIGFPTLYYSPLPQTIAQLQLIRGGSSLLYGPNPAPVLNFVSRRPGPSEPLGAYSENVGGSDDLFSTFNTIQGSAGSLSFRANLGYSQSDGERDNGGFRRRQGDVYFAYRPAKDQLWYLDVHNMDSSSGDPGKLTYAQFLADPNQAPTPFNHNWVERTSVTLGNNLDLGGNWRMEGKAWLAWQTLNQRSAAAGLAPATTTLVDEQFRSQGVDLRFAKRSGRNTLTIGTVFYHDSAPFRQWTSTAINAPRSFEGGTPRLDQARDSYYGAIFVENVFRLPHRWHIVPSMRIEHERIDIKETVRPPNLVRPLIDRSASRTVPMFGFGAGFDFGHQNETYFSVSQGYRPMRFFDVASPFSNIGPGGIPKPAKSLSWETGVHGTPIAGLFYDASLFWINFRNRVETIVISPTESIYQNSGNTRHRGFEALLSYDFLARRKSDVHLTAFGSIALLDAEFTSSDFPGRVGLTPAFAPHVTAKYGVDLRRDAHYNVSLSAQTVSSQYFQDSNLPAGTVGSANFVPAKVAGHTLVDLSADWYVTPNVRLLGGLSNLLNKHYYNRVFQNGIEPGSSRRFYVGLAAGL